MKTTISVEVFTFSLPPLAPTAGSGLSTAEAAAVAAFDLDREERLAVRED